MLSPSERREVAIKLAEGRAGELTEAEQVGVAAIVRKSISKRAKKFDEDLLRGQVAEMLTRRILCGRRERTRVEVKCDRRCGGTKRHPRPTQHITIEQNYRNFMSGINATESHWWMHWLAGQWYESSDGLPEVGIIIRTHRLRGVQKIVERHIERSQDIFVTAGGDGNRAQQLVFPPECLLWRTIIRERPHERE